MLILLVPFVLIAACCTLFFCIHRKWWRIGILNFVLIVSTNNQIQFFSFGCSNISGPRINVMCFNVYLLDDKTGAQSMDVYQTIKHESPDFLYLTEYYGTSSDTLLHILSNDYRYCDVTNRWDVNLGDVFFSNWKINSLDLLTPKLSCGNIYRIQVSDNCDTLAIYCCHLYSNLIGQSASIYEGIRNGYQRRVPEADIIHDALQIEKYPAIVMGDMNDISGSYTIRRIESAGMADAWWKGGFGYGSTYHDHGLRLRLDHILYEEERLKLTDVKVCASEVSDHNAVSAGFKVNK